jgi:hypothetical protein
MLHVMPPILSSTLFVTGNVVFAKVAKVGVTSRGARGSVPAVLPKLAAAALALALAAVLLLLLLLAAFLVAFFFPAQHDDAAVAAGFPSDAEAAVAAPPVLEALPRLSSISSAAQRQRDSVQRQSSPHVHEDPQKEHPPASASACLASSFDMDVDNTAANAVIVSAAAAVWFSILACACACACASVTTAAAEETATGDRWGILDFFGERDNGMAMILFTALHCTALARTWYCTYQKIGTVRYKLVIMVNDNGPSVISSVRSNMKKLQQPHAVEKGLESKKASWNYARMVLRACRGGVSRELTEKERTIVVYR